MSKAVTLIFIFTLLFLYQCGVVKEAPRPAKPELEGLEALVLNCIEEESITSILITKAEAILTFDEQRYEVNVTLYAKRDSIIYLSAVNSGFEILRASVKPDSIMVINRMDKIVYRAPLQRRLGYQYPVDFTDLQNLICSYCLCDHLEMARDDHLNSIVFEFDQERIKKRIILNRVGLDLRIFEFYHQQTNRYLMGERREDSFKIYSNFMITEFEIVARGGSLTFNRDIAVKMEVNPRKYSFTELR
ncbi:MAG: DUF4292 domain-containing protein [Bacteroidales bacterium]|nr:DUF4292 domain-containing protein [Bacteroidales bacterium]